MSTGEVNKISYTDDLVLISDDKRTITESAILFLNMYDTFNLNIFVPKT